MATESPLPLRDLRDCILAHAPGAAIFDGVGPFAVMLYGASPLRAPDEGWHLRISGDRHGSRVVAVWGSRASQAALHDAMEPCLSAAAAK
jgi:hypothetical protein